MARKKKSDFLDKRYTDVKEIGKGGMAVVYKAHDTQLDRDVAVKVVLSEYAGQADFRARFEREAKVLAKMRHPNIIPIYDFNSLKESLYYVMALMGDKTLRQLIDSKQLTPQITMDVANGMLSALDYAHKRGVIHRDIKSDNVFIDEDNNVLLGDFGIVRLEESDQDTALTKQGTFLGTPGYASPEQIEGKKLTAVSDIYSLGVLFYEMLTSKIPFRGNLNSIITGHLTKEPEPIDAASIHTDLHSLIPVMEKMMAKDPAKRYPQCKDAQKDLGKKSAEPVNLGIGEFSFGDEAETVSTRTPTPTPACLPIINEDDPELIKKLKGKKIELDEAHKLLDQLMSNRKEIERKTFLQLEERYNDQIVTLQNEMEILMQSARTRLTEVGLKLRTIGANLKQYEQQTVELENLTENTVIEDTELEQRKSEFDKKIDEAITGKVNLEKELAALQDGVTYGTIVKRWTNLFTPINIIAMVIALFCLYALGFIVGGSFNTIPGKIFSDDVKVRKAHDMDSSSIGTINKNERLIIYDDHRGDSVNEAVITKLTLLTSGTKYKILRPGATVIIIKENEADFLVSYKKDSKSKAEQGSVNKDAIAKNIWYYVETQSGKVGWVLEQYVRRRWKTSIMRRLVLSARRFFLLRMGKP